ncbi:MAG: KEOPS complex kinase/ATPase Bud32 [Candidatus Woesearchaeota archaeon]
MTKKLAQGAEAIIYEDEGSIVKDRFEKTYRHPELDRRLRKSRTRREAKVLTKLSDIGIAAPGLIEMDDKDMKIKMDLVPGDTVKTVIDNLESSGDVDGYIMICKEMGEKVAVLHNNGIVHQDLTTSNMIFHAEKKKIFLIDFGLSFFSNKVEDHAVDLHLLKHALESRHHRIFEKCFEAVIDAYKKKAERSDETLIRLEKVEMRGRNKARH